MEVLVTWITWSLILFMEPNNGIETYVWKPYLLYSMLYISQQKELPDHEYCSISVRCGVKKVRQTVAWATKQATSMVHTHNLYTYKTVYQLHTQYNRCKTNTNSQSRSIQVATYFLPPNSLLFLPRCFLLFDLLSSSAKSTDDTGAGNLMDPEFAFKFSEERSPCRKLRPAIEKEWTICNKRTHH